MSRVFLALYLASLALLPWSWFPPFPWLHEHAQWSDALFAAAFLAWVVDRWRGGDWPRPKPFHLAMAAYLAWAALSHLAAGLEPASGSAKLLGMAELVALAIVTADVAERPGGLRAIGWAVAITSLLTGAAALKGALLFVLGIPTPLLSDWGDLVPGPYPRIRAGFPSPNLLASFTIVASAVVAHPEARLPRLVRRASQAALAVAAVLSLSRGILGLALAWLVRSARSRSRRRVAWAAGALGATVVVALTVSNLAFDPLHPWRAHLRPEPSSRRLAVTTAAATAVQHPVFGTGPGTLPGRRYGAPCDAHLTPLNVAATLGLPALLAFAAIPIFLWRERRRPTDLATWGALAGLALGALGQDVEDFRHLWLAFGLAAVRQPSAPHPPERRADTDLGAGARVT